MLVLKCILPSAEILTISLWIVVVCDGLEVGVASAICSNMERPQKSRPPEIIKLNDAAKLAAQLMSKMTNSEWKETGVDNESTAIEPEMRPPRLGLGAKVTRHFRNGPSNDPLDRKLYAKLDAGKKQAARKMSEETPVLDNKDDDGDDEEEESRTAIFNKKRAAKPVTMPPFQGKKKRR
ncbi:putative RNA binding protein [Cucumis melo var. makuwa]|uniref:Putative RNA binding protein n=1 Tax=Cucumis melo var. makuwa TaxID=1194695 RepID=A0A5D3BV19_CUCMM|nr:putative RNA binding protein [Cucumis melo var. makuwa]